jgi:general stress protein 26
LPEDIMADLSPAEREDRVWKLMDEIKFCLFTTWDGARIDARPLTAMCDRDEGCVHFLVPAHGSKNRQAEEHPEVMLGFAHPGKDDYLAVRGRAVVSNDRAKISELFNPFAKAWWDSADDPSIRLLTVTPTEAELWEGPNRLVAGAIMLGAAVTGGRPPVGDHGQVRL